MRSPYLDSEKDEFLHMFYKWNEWKAFCLLVSTHFMTYLFFFRSHSTYRKKKQNYLFVLLLIEDILSVSGTLKNL